MRVGFAVVAALLIALAGTAAAAAQTVIFTQAPKERFVQEPAKLGYVTQPFVQGVTVTARGLEWDGWGKKRAFGSGRIDVCPNMSPCERARSVTASKLVRNAEGSNDDVYAKLAVKLAGESLQICVYREACS